MSNAAVYQYNTCHFFSNGVNQIQPIAGPWRVRETRGVCG